MCIYIFSVRHLNNEGNFRCYPAVLRLKGRCGFLANQREDYILIIFISIGKFTKLWIKINFA